MGYGPEQGYDWLINAIIEKSYKPLGVSIENGGDVHLRRL